MWHLWDKRAQRQKSEVQASNMFWSFLFYKFGVESIKSWNTHPKSDRIQVETLDKRKGSLKCKRMPRPEIRPWLWIILPDFLLQRAFCTPYIEDLVHSIVPVSSSADELDPVLWCLNGVLHSSGRQLQPSSEIVLHIRCHYRRNTFA